ncbi:MAG: DNA translocase FtsK 4TM domain-containing protein [Candidatus Doudnabacteria bacterium]
MAQKGRKKKKSAGLGSSLSSIKDSFSGPDLNLQSETKRSITIIVFLILAGIITLSLIGSAGFVGEYIKTLVFVLFGVMAYLVPVLFVAVAWLLFKNTPSQDEDYDEEGVGYPDLRTYLGTGLIALGAAGLIHTFALEVGQSAFSLASTGSAGGYLGALVTAPLLGGLGFWAGGLVILGILLIGVMITFDLSPIKLVHKVKQQKAKVLDQKVAELKINAMQEVLDADPDNQEEDEEEEEEIQEDDDAEQTIVTNSLDQDESEPVQEIQLDDRRDWKLPPFDLLNENKAKVDSGDIEANVKLIQKTLADFGIDVEMGEVNVGPTVTQYTFAPAAGVKLTQIASLQNNLALALAAHPLRLELPIPGKPLVGIEVPNKAKALVTLREVMQTTDFAKSEDKLMIALGRDVAGRPQVANLAKMPHLLIAGSTNTGKSVAINSIIVSLLFRNTPSDVKFIMVDPKRVELTPYNGIPHLLTPPVTETNQAVNALKWAVAEMERRYKLLAEAGKRNIGEYNTKNELPLPYIVILVDELADLMAVAKQDVEAAIVRLAQMARAVGIHLVLATQRPSTEVITGLIKANITNRVGFKVPSQIDSRTILDSSGAEKLLGSGDMLFVSTESAKPKRVQGAYVGEKEVHKVVDFFKQQAGAVIYNEEILEKPKRDLGIPGMSSEDMGDELFDDAKEEVIRAGKASASLLQRRLRIGYARAARLLDILEEANIIGPADGAKPREVYEISDRDRAEYGASEE